MPMKRRDFLRLSGGSSLLALGGAGLLANLPPVHAADVQLEPRRVQLRPEIEPLVRFIEDTPRDRLLEEVAARIRRGLTYRELLTALMLAGVRNVQPRPVGFKFHAVLVIHSAHLASIDSPDTDRWLPLFWALDYFKSSQAADVREGDWSMAPVRERDLPASDKARQAFIDAMDRWDESAADAAIASWVRTASVHDLFDVFCRYGVRDFREIGHKAIYVANSFRTLEVIGWQHAEPVLRSLAYALLDRNGEKANPSESDLPADRPFRRNLEVLDAVPGNWLAGKPDSEATRELLDTIRTKSARESGESALGLLQQGVAPASIFDACFDAAGELLMRAPGILALHAVTYSNAVHYAWQRCHSDATRRLLLLQNASFLPLFKSRRQSNQENLDQLEPLPLEHQGEEAIVEIFADVSRDRMTAARKVLAYLETHPDPEPIAVAARQLIFTKGRDAHDYKFSSAVLEDFRFISPPWRNRYLAASMFNLHGSGDKDNSLIQRTRAALNG